jgi:hypothetical protein
MVTFLLIHALWSKADYMYSKQLFFFYPFLSDKAHMRNSKVLIVFTILIFTSSFNVIFTSKAYGKLFGGFYRKNGLVHGDDRYKNVHQDPEQQSIRVTANHHPMKRNTLDDAPTRRNNFYKKDGLVNADPKYQDRHLTEGPVTAIVYAHNGLVKSRVNVGYATNKRLRRVSTGGFFGLFRSKSKSSSKQSIDSPR